PLAWAGTRWAIGAMVVDMNRLMNHHLVTAFGLVDDGSWDAQAMQKDMRRLFITYFGLDFTKARWAMVAIDEEQPVLLIQGDMGQPPDTMKKTMAGMNTYEVQSEEPSYLVPINGRSDLYAICPSADDVKAVAALINGTQPNLKGDPARLSQLTTLLDRAGSGDLAVAVLLDEVDDALRAEVPMGIGQSSSAFSASVADRLVVVMQGNPAELKAVATTIEEAIAAFRGEMAAELKDPALGRDDPGKALLTTYAYHISGAVMQQFQPSLEGDLLVYDVSMDTLTHPVTVIGGVVAAVVFMFKAAFDGFDLPGDASPVPLSVLPFAAPEVLGQ
ncbi:MAG: hypothetical protein AAFS10_09155, partial [Myxococcota bacterium]